MKSDEPTYERLPAHLRAEERLRAANRTLRTINRCNEALVRATDEIELAEAVCRILVEDGGMRMAWVGYREENAARTIRRIARAGFDDGYLDSIDVGWGDAPTGRGPMGVAIRTCEVCWSDDIATDPRLQHWRDQMLRRGYGCSLSLPLKLRRWCGVRRPHSLRRPAPRFRRADAFAFQRPRQRPCLWGDGDPDRADRARVEAELRRIEAYLEEKDKG